jgi:hypothetical protein
VGDEGCFQAGLEYVLDPGSASEEHIVVAGFGTVLLRDPLANDHAANVPLRATAESASLDAAGFKSVTSLCCPADMETFLNRLLASMGLQVCSKAHVQGLMHWFTCVPDMDFQYLLDVINNGNPCKYWAPIGSTCPALSSECEGKWCR